MRSTSKLIQILSIFPISVSVYSIYLEGVSSQSAMVWLLAGVTLLLVDPLMSIIRRTEKVTISGIGEISLSEIKNRGLSDLCEQSRGRRFANLIFVVAKDTGRTALAYHKNLEVYLPPGRRLDTYELPHENILRIVKEQLGIEIEQNSIFGQTGKVVGVTDKSGSTIGATEYAPPPVLVQLEKHEQRPEHRDNTKVLEHFDFVYLCVIDQEISFGHGTRQNPGWYSIDDVGEMLSNQNGKRVYPDTFEGFRSVLDILARRSG